jgi:hypothetical protein
METSDSWALAATLKSSLFSTSYSLRFTSQQCCPVYIKPVKYLIATSTGKNSSAQRYKIKYKSEIFLFIKIKSNLITRMRYSPENERKPKRKRVAGLKMLVYEIRITSRNKISAE